MIIFVTATLFIFGLLIGSFLGAFITRFARSESVVKGRSHCDSCNHQLSWRENIPLISWSLQRGRCRHCKAKLSIFYPSIELVTAVTFCLTLLVIFNFTIPPLNQSTIINTILTITLSLVIASSLIIIFFTDLIHGLIPDSAIVVGVVSTILLKLTNAGFGIWTFQQGLLDPANTLGKYLLQTGYLKIYSLNNFGYPLLWDLVAALGLSLFFFFLVVITRGRGMGLGDVKFAFLIGLATGFPKVGVAFFMSFVLGSIWALGLMILGKTTMKKTIHFGPFLVIGIPITLVWGDTLIRWYLGIH